MDSSQTPAEAVCFSLESQMTPSPILFWHPQPSVPFYRKHPKRKIQVVTKVSPSTNVKHQLDCHIHDNSDSTIFWVVGIRCARAEQASLAILTHAFKAMSSSLN